MYIYYMEMINYRCEMNKKRMRIKDIPLV